MSTGERSSTNLAVQAEHGRVHALDDGRPLPVAQLTDVEVAVHAVDTDEALPSEEDVARRLHEVLAVHDPLAMRRDVLAPTNSSSTDGFASFAWRNNGSPSSLPINSRIHARVPTLPTPTTLRAAWTSW